MVFAGDLVSADNLKNMRRVKVLIFLYLITSVHIYGQDTTQRFVFFPGTMNRPWSTSLGLTFTTTPREITEETHISIPAIDFHAVKRTGKNFNLDIRVLSQILQNHASLGIRWTHPLSKKFSISAGDDAAVWVGWIEIETINSRGYGILNYPNASVGYRFDDKLLLTIKGELLLNLYQKFIVGEQEVIEMPHVYSGEAFSITLEQPFFQDKWIILGFRVMYSNFFWQAWSLFEDYDRNIFIPQLTAALIL